MDTSPPVGIHGNTLSITHLAKSLCEKEIESLENGHCVVFFASSDEVSNP